MELTMPLEKLEEVQARMKEILTAWAEGSLQDANFTPSEAQATEYAELQTKAKTLELAVDLGRQRIATAKEEAEAAAIASKEEAVNRALDKLQSGALKLESTLAAATAAATDLEGLIQDVYSLGVPDALSSRLANSRTRLNVITRGLRAWVLPHLYPAESLVTYLRLATRTDRR